MRYIITLFLSFASLALWAQKTITQDSPPQSYSPMTSTGAFLGNIPALRDLKPVTQPPAQVRKKLFKKSNYFVANKLNNPNPQPQGGDPLAHQGVSDRGESGPEIIPGLSFEGLRDPNVTPPDPTGDVGKNHYVQMVNSSGGSWFQVWDKATGESVYGPALTSTIWNQVGTGSIGDPIIQYDHEADRWLMMELQGFFTNELLIAISDNGDPTGSWKAYRFQTLGFGDYPKLYVWPNAYFVTVNEITSGNECSGYALERSAMLAGDATFDIFRFVMPNYQAIAYQPATGADWEGGPPPPAGSPEYIFRVYDDAWDGGQDHIQIWEVNVDWNDPAQSNITGPDKIFPTPFETKVCWGGGLFDCIEQPDPGAPRITALENIIMYRAPYRNFGAYESVVFNHVSDVSALVGEGGDAAVRWYELRKSGAADWSIYQEGTYAPDLVTNRFTGTLCTDEAGNIALGYTAASQFLAPGLYVTGRRASDPLGQMPVNEYALALGAQSHYDERWGDYSNMSVDPVDGKTFWFTGEYQPEGANWGTRIGSFRIQRDTYDLTPQTLLAPVASALLGNAEPVTVEIFNGGIEPAPGFAVSLYFEGNFVTTENVPTTLAAGQSLVHTFGSTVAMPTPGDYHLRVITHWPLDQFLRNDTLDVVVPKLTSNDVAAVGKYNLPGQVCGSETDFGIIIRNASGLPMQSAKVHWRINNQPYNIYNWTGNLAPGARDTITVHATGINNGLNGLRIYTSDPNGVQDQFTGNDSIPIIKFVGNLDGTYMLAEAETTFGVLSWELRNQGTQLLANGELSQNQTTALVCSDDNTCYQVWLRSSTFSWQGHFRLYDIYGNVLVEAFSATKDSTVFNICTPIRKQVDVGALGLAAPVSGPNLTAAEPIKIRFRNFGLTDLGNIELSYRMNGGPLHTEVYPQVVTSGATVDYTFSTTEDLSAKGAYNFVISATVGGDEQTSNDATTALVQNRPLRELEIVAVEAVDACNNTDYAYVAITVRNNGLGNDHQFDAQVTLNGVVQPIIPNFVTVHPDDFTYVLLYVQGLQVGVNTVEIDLVDVDGQGPDEVPDNDNTNLSFTIDPNGFVVQLIFQTDAAPAENRWEVQDAQGNVVASGGPYPDAFTFYNAQICLEKGKCYTFHLFDTGLNGMDGGFVNLYDQMGGLYWEYYGGTFGAEISTPFCAELVCSSFAITADVVPASGPGNADGKITALPLGGTAPFTFFLNFGTGQSDPVFSGLLAGAYTLDCVDAAGCVSTTTVDLGLVGTHQPEVRRLKVSPSPTSGMAQIEMPALGDEKWLVCEVYDSKGRLIEGVRLTRWDNTLRGMIALDKQPAGVYILTVKGLSRPLTARVVKK